MGSDRKNEWACVGRAGDVPPGQVRRVKAGRWAIALVNRGGTYHALWAVCPHQGGPLDLGALWQGAVECPWHHYRFDPVTGSNVYPACVFPDDMPQVKKNLRPARVFPVRLEGQRIYVRVPQASAREER